jgi:hypothetical protein
MKIHAEDKRIKIKDKRLKIKVGHLQAIFNIYLII